MIQAKKNINSHYINNLFLVGHLEIKIIVYAHSKIKQTYK